MAELLTISGGAVDLHVHWREPGINNSENMTSGSEAALIGGYVLAADMPNNPGEPTWTIDALNKKHGIARSSSRIPVAFYAGSQPESDNIGELQAMAPLTAGIKLYGAPTTGNSMDYQAKDFEDIVQEWHDNAPDKPILFHAGKDNLEEMISLVSGSKAHPLHVCHVNSLEQIELVASAKSKGLSVTCGVTPHHLFKDDQDARTEGWFGRMQPPLTTGEESERLLYELAQGNIDIVETDHAPHSLDSKWQAEKKNPTAVHDPEHVTCFGVPGSEFALPLLFYQARLGSISMERIVDATVAKPAEILGVLFGRGTNVTWDMTEYRIEDEVNQVRSGAGWTPYLGKLAIGRIKEVRIKGISLVKDGNICGSQRWVVTDRGAEL